MEVISGGEVLAYIHKEEDPFARIFEQNLVRTCPESEYDAIGIRDSLKKFISQIKRAIKVSPENLRAKELLELARGLLETYEKVCSAA